MAPFFPSHVRLLVELVDHACGGVEVHVSWLGVLEGAGGAFAYEPFRTALAGYALGTWFALLACGAGDSLLTWLACGAWFAGWSALTCGALECGALAFGGEFVAAPDVEQAVCFYEVAFAGIACAKVCGKLGIRGDLAGNFNAFAVLACWAALTRWSALTRWAWQTALALLACGSCGACGALLALLACWAYGSSDVACLNPCHCVFSYASVYVSPVLVLM
ncbi:MAG: hypothetical protein E7D38_06370 [Staphylococcus epidermidis]|nr:hypothetical protein [Staphylococcus epidermidis]